MEVNLTQDFSSSSGKMDCLNPKKEKNPILDQLISSGGDDGNNSCLRNLFEKIADLFLRFFCCPCDFFNSLFSSNAEVKAEVQIRKEWADKSAWAVNSKNISTVAPTLVLPDDDILKEISIEDIKVFILPHLKGQDKDKAINVLNQLRPNCDPSRDLEGFLILKHLRAIVYKFQTEGLSKDKKQEICIRLAQAFTVCQPTWLAVPKAICEEFYIGRNVSLKQALFQFVEKYKSDLLYKVFESVSANNENYHHFDWNMINMVRNNYGDELGLDQSTSQYDSSYDCDYDIKKGSGKYALEIKDAFLEQYGDVRQLVQDIHREIVSRNMTFFDELVQIIEEKTGMGNLNAKLYVSNELFDMDEDAFGIVMKEETVYLLLQAIGVVV
jgi:hypothetical protein